MIRKVSSVIHHSFKYIFSGAHTTDFRGNFPGFACWGDFILNEFKNRFCAYSEQPEQKREPGLMFNTKIPEPLRVGDCVLVMGTDKGYIECLN